jgi:hypothetical protein
MMAMIAITIPIQSILNRAQHIAELSPRIERKISSPLARQDKGMIVQESIPGEFERGIFESLFPQIDGV